VANSATDRPACFFEARGGAREAAGEFVCEFFEKDGPEAVAYARKLIAEKRRPAPRIVIEPAEEPEPETRLDRAVQRSQMKVIEHQPSEGPKQNGDGLKTDLTLRPLVPDRRFRRRA
jgi:hypothetical protein